MKLGINDYCVTFYKRTDAGAEPTELAHSHEVAMDVQDAIAAGLMTCANNAVELAGCNVVQVAVKWAIPADAIERYEAIRAGDYEAIKKGCAQSVGGKLVPFKEGTPGSFWEFPSREAELEYGKRLQEVLEMQAARAAVPATPAHSGGHGLY